MSKVGASGRGGQESCRSAKSNLSHVPKVLENSLRLRALLLDGGRPGFQSQVYS